MSCYNYFIYYITLVVSALDKLMRPNKYLQHILRKNNKAETAQQCVADLQAEKEEELKTYLFLIQKRLDLS